MSSQLAEILQEYEDRVTDVREVKYVGFRNALQRFVHLLESRAELAGVVSGLPDIDFDEWYSRALATSTGMAGSGKLNWPLETHERLAMQLELIRRLSTRTVDLGSFTSMFMYTGSPQLDTRVALFLSQVFEPFSRDFRRLAAVGREGQEARDAAGSETVLERRLRWFKNHPFWSVVLLIAITVIAVGTVAGALRDIFGLSEDLRPDGEEHEPATAPTRGAQEAQTEASFTEEAGEGSPGALGRDPIGDEGVSGPVPAGGLRRPATSAAAEPDAQPRIGIAPDSEDEPGTYHPYVSALSGKSIEDRYCVFQENDWNLHTQSAPERDALLMLDERFVQLCYVPLPGLLKFSIQNVAGSAGADFTVRSLALRTRLREIAEISQTATLYLVTETVPFAETLSIPRTRGKVTIIKADSTRLLAIPDGPERMLDNMYRASLAPGEEAFYVVDLDADFEGLFILDADLVVAHHYVSEARTVIGETVFPSFLSGRFARLAESREVSVYERGWPEEGSGQSMLERDGVMRVDELISP